MDLKIYEAALARPETIQRVRDHQRDIERIGGRVEIGRPNSSGIVLARLYLPEPYTPQDVAPGLPFFLA